MSLLKYQNNEDKKTGDKDMEMGVLGSWTELVKTAKAKQCVNHPEITRPV